MKKGIFRGLFPDGSDESGDKTKFIQNRIQIVQKHLTPVNVAFTDHVSKSASLINTGGKIARTLENYSKAENVTTGMKQQMSCFADIIHEINGKRGEYVGEMEKCVLNELSDYGKMCKNVSSELKFSMIACDKERTRLRQLKRARSDPLTDPQQISLAEDEYAKARTESSKCLKSSEEQIDIFERRRLNGLKEVLAAWTVAELRFHAKALELFTEAYNVAKKINVESDIEEFRNKLRAENSPVLDSDRGETVQRSESLIHLLSRPFNRSFNERLTGIGIPHPSPSSNMSSAVSEYSDINQSCIF